MGTSWESPEHSPGTFEPSQEENAMSRFVDFKAVKAAVTMLQVLEHFGIAEFVQALGEQT